MIFVGGKGVSPVLEGLGKPYMALFKHYLPLVLCDVLINKDLFLWHYGWILDSDPGNPEGVGGNEVSLCLISKWNRWKQPRERWSTGPTKPPRSVADAHGDVRSHRPALATMVYVKSDDRPRKSGLKWCYLQLAGFVSYK